MASSAISTAVIMAAILFFSSVVTITQAQATATCAQNLIPCGAYLNTTTTPPDTCCSSIKDAVANDLTCLCNLYNTPGLLKSLGVNVTQALALTGRCSVNGDLSACGNSSADSPSGSMTPAGVPGNDGGRVAWTGFSGMILLWGASLFY